MIIGNGLLAENLKSIDRSDFVLFASGVSDSKTTDKKEFKREEILLRETIQTNSEKVFVYFSTYSILDASVSKFPYIDHKLNMESIIKQESTNYLIVRTSNIFGKKGNPKTILNYICNSIKEKREFNVWKYAYRNFLDIDNLIDMLNHVLKRKIMNQIIYLLNPIAFKIPFIVKDCEEYLQIGAKVNVLKKGMNFSYPTKLSTEIFRELNISKEDYLLKLLKKYY